MYSMKLPFVADRRSQLQFSRMLLTSYELEINSFRSPNSDLKCKFPLSNQILPEDFHKNIHHISVHEGQTRYDRTGMKESLNNATKP